MKMIKKIFLTGLAAIVPIGITIYVIVGVFNFADGILGKMINKFLEREIGYRIPGLGILLSILIIFFTGLVLRLTRMRLFRFLENLFIKAPIINKIYLPIKEIFNFLFFLPQKKFKSVVLVEYPRKGLYSLGFITNQKAPIPINQKKQIYSVFIPTTPSPLTGFTVFVDEEELIFLEISVESALKLIVSGGLITPYETSTM